MFLFFGCEGWIVLNSPVFWGWACSKVVLICWKFWTSTFLWTWFLLRTSPVKHASEKRVKDRIAKRYLPDFIADCLLQTICGYPAGYLQLGIHISIFPIFLCCFHSISAVKKNAQRTKDGQTDGRTDGPTDRPTDRPSYRDAWTDLKLLGGLTNWQTDWVTSRVACMRLKLRQLIK